MRKLFFLAVTAMVGVILFYLSRFWFLSLWPRSGLFGIEHLRPQGGLLGRWLRGTDLAPFELIIWAVACFLVLTWLQMLYDRLTQTDETGDGDD